MSFCGFKRKVLPALALFLGLASSFAQVHRQVQHYGVENGLSLGSVTCLLQDKQGFLWVGTLNGLDRFDGYSFREFLHDPRDTTSLLDNQVTALSLGPDGKIWIGTAAGINVYDPVRDKLSKAGWWKKPGEKKSEVLCLQFLGNGRLAIGSTIGFSLVDVTTGKREDHPGVENDPRSALSIKTIYESGKTGLWLGSENGELLRWDAASHRLSLAANIICPGINDFDGNAINSIDEYKNGTLLIATGCGFRFYEPSPGKFVNFFRENAFTDTLCNCAFHDIIKMDGEHFFVLSGRRIDELDFSKGRIRTVINNVNDVDELFTTGETFMRDRQGLIWVGDYGKGLFCMRSSTTGFDHIGREPGSANQVINPFIFSFCEKGDSAFIGSNWGIDILSIKEGKLYNPILFPGKKPESFPVAIQDLLPGDSNDIWFLCRWSVTGLGHWSLGTGKIKIYGKEDGFTATRYTSFIRRKNGQFWIASRGQGILIFDPSLGIVGKMISDSTHSATISSDNISCLFEDAKGRIWAGSRKGLDLIDPSSRVVKRFRLDQRDTSSLCCTMVSHVNADQEGNIWVGTDFGFAKYDEKSGGFINYDRKNGLPDNFVNAIVPDSSGFLWISTNKGLSRFDPKKGTFKNYTVDDGLQGLEFDVGAGYAGRSGLFYFGGVNGFNYFHPRSIVENDFIPPVYFTGVKVFDKPLQGDTNIILRKSISLSYDQNFLTFEFTGLNFLMPSKNRYACKLEGVDHDWVDLGDRRTVTYSDLRPGNYVMRIRASNNDGVWNENGASLIIEISPPFYKTKWFLAMCGIMGLAGAWNYVRMREKKLKAEKKILEQKVEERTVELRIEKEKVVAAHQDIKDSINYARRIQSTILPGEKEWKSILPDSFVLYKPRDIVSGDFFWLLKEKDLVLVAAADCTGHGVPGAFMSMIGHTQLNDIVKQEGITDTAAILDRLHVKVSAAMKQDAGSGARDGMDIALVAFDPIKMMLHYSGANRPLLLVRGGEIKEFKADKFPIGGGSDTGVRNFSSNRIELCKGDIIYLFSDGFGDQFGGPKGKKFGTKQLREILLEISAISISRQKETLEDRFNAWKRDVEQVDDVLVIGFRV